MKAIAIKMTNRKAAEGLIMPEGISRIKVLVFSASINRSTYLLNAIAALLANIIHSKINRNSSQLMDDPSVFTPRKNARKANGSAKMV